VSELDRDSAIEARIDSAIQSAPIDADLVVLPYLGSSSWFLDQPDRKGYAQAERSPTRTMTAACSSAKLKGVAVVVSFYEAVAEGTFYSSGAVIDADGSLIGTFRQAHGVNQPGWHEQLYFQPGTTGSFPVFGVSGVKLGLLLGSDLWAPEAARLLALGGAEIIVALVCLRDIHARQAEQLAAARAIENGCTVVLANRGVRPATIGPEGKALTSQPGRSDLTTFTVALAKQREQTRAFNPLASRRPAIYGGLARGNEGALP